MLKLCDKLTKASSLLDLHGRRTNADLMREARSKIAIQQGRIDELEDREKELLGKIGELKIELESNILDGEGFDYKCVDCSVQYNVEFGENEDCPACGCDK